MNTKKIRENTTFVNENFYKSKFSDVNTVITTITLIIVASISITMTSKIQNAINETIKQYVLKNSLVSTFAKSSKSVIEHITSSIHFR